MPAVRPREIVVADEPVSKLDPSSYEDVLKLIGLLIGKPVEFRCKRLNPSATNPVGSRCNTGTNLCQVCIAEDRLKYLVGKKDPWTVSKLNQILQLVGTDIVSLDFFEAFWHASTGNDKFFKAGLTQFRAYAMLLYGSFAYAFRRLGRAPVAEIMKLVGDWGQERAWHIARFSGRKHGTTLRQPIDPKQSWHVGYISSTRLTQDLEIAGVLRKVRDGLGLTPQESAKYNALPQSEKTWWNKPGQLEKVSKTLDALEQELLTVRALATANMIAYLAANHIDVYVATSMRERAEFEAAAKFLSDLRDHSHLKPLEDVTFFDPTDSFASDRIDKGLLEALMLRRAASTVYMVQETDTLGKDSELAATLALGKPVIAYVPNKVETTVFEESLAYLYRRAAMLLPEAAFEPQHEQDVIDALGHMHRARSALQLGGTASRPLTVAQKRAIAQLRHRTAAAELKALNKRADFLRVGHPLALQVAQRTGVANGVLVARDASNCAELVFQALTFSFEFDIVESPVSTDGASSGTLLVERISQCPFRVVTAHEVLTNSFWTRYIRGEEVATAT